MHPSDATFDVYNWEDSRMSRRIDCYPGRSSHEGFTAKTVEFGRRRWYQVEYLFVVALRIDGGSRTFYQSFRSFSSASYKQKLRCSVARSFLTQGNLMIFGSEFFNSYVSPSGRGSSRDSRLGQIASVSFFPEKTNKLRLFVRGTLTIPPCS